MLKLWIIFSVLAFSRAGVLAETLWQNISSPVKNTLSQVVWGNGHWLATGYNGAEPDLNGFLIGSDDGVVWREMGKAPVAGGRLIFTGGRFLMRSDPFLTDSAAKWVSSTDGVTWAPFAVPAGNTILDITFAGGRWVCVGDGGTFATATVPGEWTVDNTGLTGMPVSRVLWFGGRFHAFSMDNYGMLHYASNAEGSGWTLQPRAPILIAVDSAGSLEIGDITSAQGVVERVLVLTGNIQPVLVGRASPTGIEWSVMNRSGFGKLYPRKSADASLPGGFRNEWVLKSAIQTGNESGLPVLQLKENNETPALEPLNTSFMVYAVAAGPDAMIAVGEGGVIRRYPTAVEAAAVPVNLEIAPAIQLKWSSRAGHNYLVERSADGLSWQSWLPAMPGTGQPMTWIQPADNPRGFFRVREQ